MSVRQQDDSARRTSDGHRDAAAVGRRRGAAARACREQSHRARREADSRSLSGTRSARSTAEPWPGRRGRSTALAAESGATPFRPERQRWPAAGSTTVCHGSRAGGARQVEQDRLVESTELDVDRSSGELRERLIRVRVVGGRAQLRLLGDVEGVLESVA